MITKKNNFEKIENRHPKINQLSQKTSFIWLLNNDDKVNGLGRYRIERVIKGTKILVEIKRMKSKIRHGKQTNKIKNKVT